jgi:hypothetical protein
MQTFTPSAQKLDALSETHQPPETHERPVTHQFILVPEHPAIPKFNRRLEFAPQKAFSDTRTGSCSCGQTDHHAAILHGNVPYCRRLGPGGAGRPKIINPSILSYPQIPIEFEFFTKVSQRERERPNDEWKTDLVEMAVQNLKRLSQRGQKLRKVTI